MTNQLTKKQIDNRAYYAKHAEKIRAQKRDSSFVSGGAILTALFY